MKYKHIPLINHPKNEEGVFNNLIEKYNKNSTLYIGVDFDNTLWPYGMVERNEIPQGFKEVIELLQQCKKHGLKLCLWTLPLSQENLDWKIQWCKNHGIEMDYINESPLLNEYSKEFKKPHFNLLLDDVAGLESSYSILVNIINYIDSTKQNG